MELVNIFLESDTGRSKIIIKYNDKLTIWQYVDKFIDILKQYINVEESSFYLAIKDKDIFVFKYDKGSISLIENEFAVFDENLLLVDDYNYIIGIEFIITNTMPINIFPKNNVIITATVNNHRFYYGMSL
nr:virion core protein [Wadden Sea poxvirus]